MRLQRYRVILFDRGSGTVAGERRVLARSDQDAAECLYGIRLAKSASLQQLAVQVAPVDSPAQRQLFYVSTAWEAAAGKPRLALVHAYTTRDDVTGLSLPSRFKATIEAIATIGGEPLDGSAEVVAVDDLTERGEHMPLEAGAHWHLPDARPIHHRAS